MFAFVCFYLQRAVFSVPVSTEDFNSLIYYLNCQLNTEHSIWEYHNFFQKFLSQNMVYYVKVEISKVTPC